MSAGKDTSELKSITEEKETKTEFEKKEKVERTENDKSDRNINQSEKLELKAAVTEEEDPMAAVYKRTGELTPQEKINAGKSYLNLESTIDNVTVSLESGSLYIENTDFIIHGKNGFELSVKRIYDTATAKKDMPSLIEFISMLSKKDFDKYSLGSFLSYSGVNVNFGLLYFKQYDFKSYSKDEIIAKLKTLFLKKGGYAQCMGAGWRLNFPYIADIPVAKDDRGRPVMIRMPSGCYYQLNQMEQKGSRKINSENYSIYENHKNEDFTVLSTFNEKKTQKENELFKYKLITKDGITYDFNDYGQVTRIQDASISNVITIDYNEDDNLISYITDPNGNKITFKYNKNEKYIIPVITDIIMTDKDNNTVSKMEYRYGTLTNQKPGCNILRLLRVVSDGKGRQTEYSYENCGDIDKLGVYGFEEETFNQSNITFNQQNLKNQFGYFDFPYSNVLDGQSLIKTFALESPDLLKTIETPLEYIQTIEYEKTLAKIDHYKWECPTKRSRVMVKSIKNTNGYNERTIEYSYTQKMHNNCQIMVCSATVKEGKKETRNTYGERKDSKTGDYTSYLQKSDVIIIAKDNTENKISSTEYTWNDKERLVKEKGIKGIAVKETTYEYDFWGNVNKETVTRKLMNGQKASQETTRITRSKYFNIESEDIANFPEGVPKTIEQNVKETRNLLINQSIEENGVTIYKAFAYDEYGRKIWEGVDNNGHWAATKTAYCANYRTAQWKRGRILKITAPSGQVYKYEYTTDAPDGKTQPRVLTTKVTAENVDLGSEVKNISTYTTEDLILNRVTSKTDGKGNKTEYEYDADGRLTATLTPDGVKESFIYDDRCKSIFVSREKIMVNGKEVDRLHKRYILDSKGNITKIQVQNNSSVGFTMKRGGHGLVSEDDYTDFITEEFTYDARDNITSYKDPSGNVTKYSYDVLNRIKKQTNMDGSYRTNEYNDANNSVTITDEEGKYHYEHFDFDGNKIEIRRYKTRPRGYDESRNKFEYNLAGDCILEKTPLEMKISHAYNSPFGLTLTSYNKENGYFENLENAISKKLLIKSLSITYNDLGLKEEETEGFSLVEGKDYGKRFIKNIYNGMGNLLSVESGYKYFDAEDKTTSEKENRKIQYQYDENGNLIKEIYPAVKIGDEKETVETYKTYSYDSMNRLVSKTDEEEHKTEYEYNHDGKLTKITDPLKYEYNYEYDRANRLIMAELPPAMDGKEKNNIAFEYDSCGNITKRTDPDGSVTQWEYDTGNRKVSEIITGSDGTQIIKNWTYWKNGLVKSETNGNATTSYEYDVWNRLSKVTYPDGQTEEYEYNFADQITSIKYADGSVKRNSYNKFGYLIRETDEEYKIIEHGYNVWGEETKRIEANTDGSGDQVWDIKYNYFGQVWEEKRNNRQEWSYKYNLRGLLEEKTDPKGVTITNTFDKCGRITKEIRSFGTLTKTRTFEYDSLGFIKNGTDGSVTCVMNGSGNTYKSNAYNLITKCEVNIDGKTLTLDYSYDKGKRISKVVYPESVSVCFGYNGTGLLKEIGTGTNETTYANGGKYNTSGNLKELSAGNTTKLTQTIDEAKNLLTAYSWGISGKNANTLTWNNRGNITAQTKNGISYTYEYDKKNQLTKEKWEGEDKKNTWTYDGKGNRLTESKNEKTERSITCYQYSDLIKQDGIWKYNYDLNGNLIAKGNNTTGAIDDGTFEGWKFNATVGEVWKYTYDLFNRLVKVEHSVAGINALKTVAEYIYDYRDLMVCRKSGSVCEYFAFDNDGKLLYTEKGNEKHDYVYANGKLCCEIVSKGSKQSVYYHHTDHLRTTVCITDSTSKVVWECEQEAFGNVISKTNNSFTPNFTGKFLDENTGLYYFNARWYDSEMGRFITEDPARDARNWFIYCKNNPMVLIDPTGLAYYTGPTGSSVQSSNDAPKTHEYSEQQGTPSGFAELPNTPNQQDKMLQNELKRNNIISRKKTLLRLGVGFRKARIIGLSASCGFVFNPNNLWDSGIFISGGVGIGIEESFSFSKSEFANTVIDALVGAEDFTHPTSTSEIEGITNTIYAGAGIGFSTDIDSGKVLGVHIGSIGGGVYKEGTCVITGGQIVEGICNTSILIMNNIINNSGMSKLIGNFTYIELDGK